MEFVKKFNNNVALAKDENNIEWVIMGKAVGFEKKKGSIIEESSIKRRFVAESSESISPVLQAIQEIDPKVFEVTSEIIKRTESLLNISFQNKNFLTLADHLNFAIVQVKQGIDHPEFLHWEVKKLYPEAYQAALVAMDTVEEQLDLKLPKSEEVFLTYHFVNAQHDNGKMEETIQMTNLIQRIVEIVKYHLQVQLNEESLNYSRFVTHLRYFTLRQMSGETYTESSADRGLLEIVKEKYVRAYEAAEKVSKFLDNEKGWKLNSDELLYLTLHIWRIYNRTTTE